MLTKVPRANTNSQLARRVWPARFKARRARVTPNSSSTFPPRRDEVSGSTNTNRLMKTVTTPSVAHVIR